MTTATSSPEQRKKVWQWLVGLCSVVVLMFVFAIWVMPPFYDAICRITGLNGKVTVASAEDIAAANQPANDTTDTSLLPQINVQFVTDTDPKMPWTFESQLRSVRIAPGVQQVVTFTVYNPTDKDMVGQAIPSVTPAQAMSHIKKIECFCFQRQELKAGETRELSMMFYLDKELPLTIPTVTLAYKFFDITDQPPSAG